MNLSEPVLSTLAILLLWTPLSYGVTVTDIRLINNVNANLREGRLEIQVDRIDIWGTVCDDKFDNLDATVACRMLGFTNGGEAVLSNTFGNTGGDFLLDDTSCDGDEETLTKCIASMSIDCKRNTDQQVGVRCNANSGVPSVTLPPTTTVRTSIISGNCERVSPTVRLFGKEGVDGMGFVEVQNDLTQRWGFVCDDFWNEDAAKIVCAQLCYPTNYTAKPGVPAEHTVIPTNPTIVMDNVNCQGNELTLQDCPNNGWSNENCLANGGELAGVQCVAAQYRPPPSPVPELACNEGKMIASFSRLQDPFLEEKHLSVYNQASCTDVSKSTTTDLVTIVIPVDKCNTILQRNASFITYTNEIMYDYTNQEEFITRVNTYRIKIDCAFPVDGSVTQRIQPLTEFVTQKSTGIFQLVMQVYRNDSFVKPETTSPVQIPLGEFLNMAILLEENDPRLKLVVTDCISTPTGDMTGSISKELFANKCRSENSLSFYPLSKFKFGFRFKPFKFVGYELLYIQCDAIICLSNSTSAECDRTCNNSKPASPVRKKRSARSVLFKTSINSQAIVIYDPHKKDKDFGKEDYKVIINNKDSERSTTRSTSVEQGSISKPSSSASSLTTLLSHSTARQTDAPGKQSKPAEDGNGLTLKGNMAMATRQSPLFNLLISLVCARLFL